MLKSKNKKQKKNKKERERKKKILLTRDATPSKLKRGREIKQIQQAKGEKLRFFKQLLRSFVFIIRV